MGEPKPTKRERGLACEAIMECGGSESDSYGRPFTHYVANALAAYREELLAPFEALVRMWRAEHPLMTEDEEFIAFELERALRKARGGA